MTPMMEQYFEVKNQYKDYLLFYRLGDFYEMFFDDAIIGSRELELTLTGRDCGEAERAPMCGVPFHSADIYIGKLIEKGYKVAICEQTEDPALAKGLVRREVIRIVTPGTLIESELLSEQKNNYLCTLSMGEFESGVCFADISTAQIYVTSFSGAGMNDRIRNELGTYAPREILCNLSKTHMGAVGDYLSAHPEIMLTDAQTARFDVESCRKTVREHFGDSIRSEVYSDSAMLSAVGAMLDYIRESEKRDISYLKELNVYTDGQYLEMDVNTRRNLELTESMRTKEKRGSLLWVLDRTKTAPGARCLRKWVEHPLLSAAEIKRRQGAVAELAGAFMLREELADTLSRVHDMERLVTRIVYGTANAKDLRAVHATASVLPDIARLLGECKSERLCGILSELDLLEDVVSRIDEAIDPDPPVSIREGKMIRPGFNKDVDELRAIMEHGSEWVKKVEAEEREKTGIKTLRSAYNRVFGY